MTRFKIISRRNPYGITMGPCPKCRGDAIIRKTGVKCSRCGFTPFGSRSKKVGRCDICRGAVTTGEGYMRGGDGRMRCWTCYAKHGEGDGHSRLNPHLITLTNPRGHACSMKQHPAWTDKVLEVRRCWPKLGLYASLRFPKRGVVTSAIFSNGSKGVEAAGKFANEKSARAWTERTAREIAEDGTSWSDYQRRRARKRNPGLGMEPFVHTWVTADGTQVRAGDLIEYRSAQGQARGDAPRLRRGTVLQHLVFGDHVMVSGSPFGMYVGDREFVRVVRRSRR